PTGAQTEYRYNGFGERTQTFDPDVGPTPIVYDYYKDGMLKSSTSASGQSTVLTYDALHRLQYEDLFGVGGRRHRYDEAAGRQSPGVPPVGHLTSIQDMVTSVTEQFQYDSIGRVVTSSQSIGGAASDTVQFSYDALSRLKSVVYPDGKEVEQTFRPDGRTETVRGVNLPITFASNTGYTPWGALAQVHYGNGLDVTYTYEPNVTWMTGVRACFSCGLSDED